jgi:hypothetical protein
MRKVAHSIPDEATGFNWPNSSSRTIALEVDSACNMNLPAVKGGRRVELTTLPPSMSPDCLENVGTSTSHSSMAIHGLLRDTFTFLLKMKLSDEKLIYFWNGNRYENETETKKETR